MSINPSATNSLTSPKQNQAVEAKTTLSPLPSAEKVSPVQPVEAIARPAPSVETATEQQPPKKSEEPEQTEQAAARIENAVEKLNSFMKSMERNLEFSYDQDINRTIITVRDKNTDEVVRQLPSEEALKLAEALQDNQTDAATTGKLLDIKT